MKPFPLHTLDSAPAASRPPLQALHDAFGMLPNVAGAMAASPVLIGSLAAVFGKVHAGSFDEAQIQIVLLTDAVANASAWPVAFHSALALQLGVPAAEVAAIRAGRLPGAPGYAALSALARAMIEKRGRLDRHEQLAFLDAGFAQEQLLEVIAIVAASTLTNYAASIAQPPLEEAFRAHAWTH